MLNDDWRSLTQQAVRSTFRWLVDIAHMTRDHHKTIQKQKALHDDKHIYTQKVPTHPILELHDVFGRLELEWCEKKTPLPGWWLEDGAGAM